MGSLLGKEIPWWQTPTTAKDPTQGLTNTPWNSSIYSTEKCMEMGGTQNSPSAFFIPPHCQRRSHDQFGDRLGTQLGSDSHEHNRDIVYRGLNLIQAGSGMCCDPPPDTIKASDADSSDADSSDADSSDEDSLWAQPPTLKYGQRGFGDRKPDSKLALDAARGDQTLLLNLCNKIQQALNITKEEKPELAKFPPRKARNSCVRNALRTVAEVQRRQENSERPPVSLTHYFTHDTVTEIVYQFYTDHLLREGHQWNRMPVAADAVDDQLEIPVVSVRQAQRDCFLRQLSA